MPMMSDIYPLRASGEYAGTKCHVSTCQQYARFVVLPMGEPDGQKGVCGHHLTVTARTVHLQTGKSAVIQEVPGKWGRELIVAGGVVARIGNTPGLGGAAAQ